MLAKRATLASRAFSLSARFSRVPCLYMSQPLGQCLTSGCGYYGHVHFAGFCSGCRHGATPDAIEAAAAAEEMVQEAKKAKDRDETTWVEEGITASADEFRQLEAIMSCFVASCVLFGKTESLKLSLVAEVLLESRRLLTPHQAKALYLLLKRAAGAERSESTTNGRRWALVGQAGLLTLLAGFLSDPERWCAIPHSDRQAFWPDDNGECFWANSQPPDSPRLARDRAVQTSANRTQPSYANALRSSLRAERARRVAVAACLTQQFPPAVLRRNNLAYDAQIEQALMPLQDAGAHTGGAQAHQAAHATLESPLTAATGAEVGSGLRPVLPALPRDLCACVLDFLEPPPVQPTDCSWYRMYGNSWPDGCQFE